MSEIGGLYVIIDPAACRGRDAVSVAAAALRGGAAVLQWRDKRRDKGEQLREARAVYALCRQHEAVFIVNDHADLALALGLEQRDRGAIGVHVGQKDLPLATVKRILPSDFLVGVSTNNPEEARAAASAGASYVAVGDIFGTTVKEGARPASPDRLAAVKSVVGLPVIGIGGINSRNLDEVLAAGADGVAVISAICGADDPEAAARELVEAIERAKASNRRSAPGRTAPVSPRGVRQGRCAPSGRP